MIKREDYTFEELLNPESDSKSKDKEDEQLTMNVSSEDDDEGTLVKEYPPIHYRRLKEYE